MDQTYICASRGPAHLHDASLIHSSTHFDLPVKPILDINAIVAGLDCNEGSKIAAEHCPQAEWVAAWQRYRSRRRFAQLGFSTCRRLVTGEGQTVMPAPMFPAPERE